MAIVKGVEIWFYTAFLDDRPNLHEIVIPAFFDGIIPRGE